MLNKTKNLLKHYLGDIIYGANDGIITTFTIISGVQGAQLSHKIIIILGLINLLSDGISMGASRFLSIRSKIEVLNQNRPNYDATQHGIITFLAFIAFGSIPLISFFMPGFEEHQFLVSTVACFISLFLAGGLSYFISKQKWWRTSIEMVVIGGTAALAAYGLGYILAGIVS